MLAVQRCLIRVCSDLVVISSYHIVEHKWQNRLKVGTEKPKQKVTMQSRFVILH